MVLIDDDELCNNLAEVIPIQSDCSSLSFHCISRCFCYNFFQNSCSHIKFFMRIALLKNV